MRLGVGMVEGTGGAALAVKAGPERRERNTRKAEARILKVDQ